MGATPPSRMLPVSQVNAVRRVGAAPTGYVGALENRGSDAPVANASGFTGERCSPRERRRRRELRLRWRIVGAPPRRERFWSSRQRCSPRGAAPTGYRGAVANRGNGASAENDSGLSGHAVRRGDAAPCIEVRWKIVGATPRRECLRCFGRCGAPRGRGADGLVDARRSGVSPRMIGLRPLGHRAGPHRAPMMRQLALRASAGVSAR